jgi:hypothetical protein
MRLTFSGIAVAMLLVVVLAAWYHNMRVRETANRIAGEICRRQSLQLLDGTVSLAALRPRVSPRGLHLERTYVFDYTSSGAERARGFIIMLGQNLHSAGLDSVHQPLEGPLQDDRRKG